MKSKTALHLILITFILLLRQTSSYAQVNNGRWQPWMQHPCYKGLSISVLNMGFKKEIGSYLWGVRFRNDYDIAISFVFDLTIGTEKIAEGILSVNNLKAGEIFTEGADSITANPFKTSSTEWQVGLGDICFDGMNCGGVDSCYAGCDSVEKKPNQPCGLAVNTRSGVWISTAGTKNQLQSKIRFTEEGLVFTRSGVSFEFTKISAGEYEWVKGKEYRLTFKKNKNAHLSFNGDYIYPPFIFQPGSSLSDTIIDKPYEDASYFEGEWINKATKKRMTITNTKEGLSLKKADEPIPRLYIIMPNLSYRSASEKDKLISLAGPNYESLIFYQGFTSVDGYTRLKPLVQKKLVVKQ